MTPFFDFLLYCVSCCVVSLYPVAIRNYFGQMPARAIAESVKIACQSIYHVPYFCSMFIGVIKRDFFQLLFFSKCFKFRVS